MPDVGTSLRPTDTAVTYSYDNYEHALISIFKQVLGIKAIKSEDNFFDLGGNSLNGLQVVAKISKAFSTQIPASTFFEALFEAPTIAELARFIEESYHQEGGSDLNVT